MSVNNSYPNLPVIPVKFTKIDRNVVQNYINSTNYPASVKSSAFTIFRIESGNGNSGVNDNYGGVQADGGRWGQPWDSKVVATTVTKENTTGKLRRFVVWDKWQTGIDFLLKKVADRGLFVGGTAKPYANIKVDTVLNLTRAYEKEWVTGKSTAEPSKTKIDTFSSIYRSAISFFSTKEVEAKKKIS